MRNIRQMETVVKRLTTIETLKENMKVTTMMNIMERNDSLHNKLKHEHFLKKISNICPSGPTGLKGKIIVHNDDSHRFLPTFGATFALVL